MQAESRPLVIAADDDRKLLTVVEQTLQSWHYQVACATDAEQLLLLISKEQVAVLLLDLQFGKSDGLQVLERVLDFQADLPVVMLTGHGSM